MRIHVTTRHGQVPLEVELALTSGEQARGLSHRAPLPPGHGMLFVFAEPAAGPFVFFDTMHPLDVALVDGGVIVAVRHAIPAMAAEPLPLEPAVRHVLELPGGALAAHGIEVGDAVALPDDLSLATHRPPVVIVDCVGVGVQLAHELGLRGHPLILVDAGGAHVRAGRGSDVDVFAALITHEGEPAELAPRLAPWRPAAVIAGSEEGVTFADALAEALGLPANDPAGRAARRDKHLMVEALARVGLPSIRQIRARDAQTIIDWKRRAGFATIVVKPTNAAGSDGVHVCRDDDDVARAVGANIGRTNRLGLVIDELVAQERVVGPELYVNTASRDGVHHVTDVWRSAKRRGADDTLVYDHFELAWPDEPGIAEVMTYVVTALDALGVRWGAGHTEVIVGPDGPRLIDFGGRVDGTHHPKLLRHLTGTSQVELTLDAFLDPIAWTAKTAAPSRPRLHARSSCLVFEDPGIVRAIPGEALLARLATWYDLRLFPAIGRMAVPTRDAYSYPGILTLVDRLPAPIESDHMALRALERQGMIFDIEPPAGAPPPPRATLGRLHARATVSAAPCWMAAQRASGWHVVERDEGLVRTLFETLESRLDQPARLHLDLARELARDHVDLVVLPPVALEVVPAPGRSALLAYGTEAQLSERWLARVRELGLEPAEDAEDPLCLGVVDLLAPVPPPLDGAPFARWITLDRALADLPDLFARVAALDGPAPFVEALVRAAGPEEGGVVVVEDSDGLAGMVVIVIHDRIGHVVHAALRASGDVAGRVDELIRVAMTRAAEAGADLFSLGAVVDERRPETVAELGVYTDICRRFEPVVAAFPPPLRLAPDPDSWALGVPPDPDPTPEAAALRARATIDEHPLQSVHYLTLLQKLGWSMFVVGDTTCYVQDFPEGRVGWVQLPRRIDLAVLLEMMAHMRIARVGIEPSGRMTIIDRDGHEHDLVFDPWEAHPWIERVRALGLGFHRRHYMLRKTFLLDLSGGREGLLARAKESARKSYRRAHRRGLVYEELELPRPTDPRYLEIKDLHDRWHTVGGYEGEWYVVEPIMRYFRGDARVVLARLDGALVGVQFALVRNKTVFAYYQFVLREAMHTHASTGLLFEVARIGEERGCDLFDVMGAWDERFPEDRPGWRGFTAFKEQLRPVPLYYPPTVVCDLVRFRVAEVGDDEGQGN